jgi:DUF4097 and DUF4098 domain-containing protein YvlB
VLKANSLRSFGSLAVVAAAALLGSACEITVDAGPYSAHEEKRFQVSGTPDLSLTTFDGSVEVRSWDRPEVLVEVEKRASDKALAEAIKVSVEQSGNAIAIDVRRPDGVQSAFGLRISPSARIVASVPQRCNLVVRSDDGSIRIERVEGRIDLNSRDGGVRLSGRLQAVKLKTGDGSVEVRAGDGSAMTDDWEIRTGDGGLRLELPESFGASLDASTGDGSVRVLGFGGPTTSGRDRADRGDLKRQLGAGGKLLRLRSNSGSIVVKTL